MNRDYYKNLARSTDSTSRIVESDKQLVADISYRSFKLVKNIERLTLPDGIKWCYGYSNYINNQGRMALTRNQRQSFQRGQIVFVDFFGGFSEELTYDHNAVVLKATLNGLIVAPITSATRYYNNTNDGVLVKLPKRIRSKGNLLYNSTIRLDQLRYISRTRILKRHGLINDGTVLDEIGHKLTKYLSPVYMQNLLSVINNLRADCLEKQEREAELSRMVVDLEKENEELKLLIETYEKQEDN